MNFSIWGENNVSFSLSFEGPIWKIQTQNNLYYCKHKQEKRYKKWQHYFINNVKLLIGMVLNSYVKVMAHVGTIKFCQGSCLKQVKW